MKHLIKICVAAMLLFSSLNSQAQCSVEVREAFGAATSLMLYNTYITIGSIADMQVKEVIKKDYAVTLTTEQIAMLEAIFKSFDKAAKDKSGSLSKDDIGYLKSSLLAIDNLRLMAIALKQFLNDGSTSEQYSTFRNAAWKEISELLGIEE